MTRRKRLLSLLLSVLMICTLLPPRASAAPTLYFTAVNDRMCDLSDETMPFWQNGLLYVAGATVDGPDDLGIRYSYNQEKSVAILYKGQRVLYCDLTAGTMENNRTGEQYAGSPIVRSGMVFFPITALAKIFDLKYSSTKIAYGYLLRIRDDNAVLSDEYFIDAATDPIQKRYAQYERAHAAAESEQPETPPPVETPTRRDDLTVYLLLPAANGSPCSRSFSPRLKIIRAMRRCSSRPSCWKARATACAALPQRETPSRYASARRPLMRRSRRSNGATTRCGTPQACARGSSISKARTRRCARRSSGRATVLITVNTIRLYKQRLTIGRIPRSNGPSRSGSVRLYIGAESSVSSALGTALSRLRAESCTIAALNEVTA